MHRSCRRAPAAAGGAPHGGAGCAASPQLGILGVLVWRVGTGPFVAGLRAGRRRLTGGGKRGGRGDDPLLRVAVDGRGARPRGRAAAAHRRGRLLPVAVPQRRDTGRGARGRGPGRASRPGRRGHEPWPAISGLGAGRRPGRAGRRGRLCTGPPALAGSTRGARGRTRGGGGDPGSSAYCWLVLRWGPLARPGRRRAPAWVRAVRRAGPTSGQWRSPGLRGHESSSPRSWPWQATS